VYEDSAYRFVTRHYGSGETATIPGFFVYSKQRNAWIEILSLSTEHARLGHSPDDILLTVGWDYGELINKAFASMPLRTSGSINFPDRIVDVGAEGAYRLDFNSRLKRDVSLTSFWLAKGDLQEAFEGRRTPALVDKRDLRGVAFDDDPRDGLIVDVRIGNGEWLRWRIDTKLSGILVDPSGIQNRVAAEPKDTRLDLSIGSTTLPEQPVTLARASTRSNGFRGVLGTAFFDRFAVSVDYDVGRLRPIEPAGEGDDGQPIAIEWQRGAPVMNAKIVEANGRTSDARLCVDTTEPRGLVLRQPASRMRRLASLHIGSFRLDNLPVFSDPAVAATCDGVLGNALLRRFRVTFDRRRQRLLLTPGALFGVPYDYDLTGLTIVQNGRTFGVGRVAPGTIASAAGFRAGDVILEIDGRPTAGMDLWELRASFRHDGRERLLTIHRHGVRHVLSLALPLVKE
jgi:hypothetical protein